MAGDTHETLRALLDRKEQEYEDALAEQGRLRGELRDVERELQRLRTHVVALQEMISDVDPDRAKSRVVHLHRDGTHHEEVVNASLVGVPRVQAVEFVLAEAPGQQLHRRQIMEALRSRGFPNEQLGDTSAALAYLKRAGRVENTGRGYWRLARSRATG